MIGCIDLIILFFVLIFLKDYRLSETLMGSFLGFGCQDSNEEICLLEEKEDQEGTPRKVVAVIVTICSENSYDPLFTTIRQKSVDGTKVEVYTCPATYISGLCDTFNGEPQGPISERLMSSVSSVDPDCVVINWWECCGAYVGRTFKEGKDKVFSSCKLS